MRAKSSLLKYILLATSACAGSLLIWLSRPGDQTNLVYGCAALLAVSLAGQVALVRSKEAAKKKASRQDVPDLDTKALNAHAMVLMTDGAGRINFVNDRFLALTGFVRDDLLGKAISAIHHSEDAAIYASIAQAHIAGEIWIGEQRIIGKSGASLWTQVTSIPRLDRKRRSQGSMSVHTDISVQKLAAAAHDAMTSLNLLSEPVFMACAVSHEVVFANDAAAKLFEWNRDNMSDIQISSLNVDCDKIAVQKKIVALKAGTIDQFSFDAVHNDVPFLAEVQLIQAQDFGTRLYVVFRNQVAVQKVSRAKDELVATVSHELRTPLTSIKGALGLIRSGAAGELTDKIRDLLDIAYRNADRLVLIVNDILDLEKLAAGQMDYNMERQDLVQTVTEAINANEAFAERFGVTVRLTADDGPAWAIYDADRMHQVMSNLISNACKFSAAGAQIDVTVKTQGDKFRISVVDKGVGIPSSALERIFDRFTQVGKANRSRKGGTGLGLSIVKGIVESHGGKVNLSSIEGQGTTVIVTLKQADAAVQPQLLYQSSKGAH